MNFNERIEQIRKDDEERGYENKDIEKIKARIINERRTWIKKFDNYIEYLLSDDPNQPTNFIIQKAAELTDARKEFLLEKFEDDLNPDD
jgi:hypothetical protein